MGKTFFGAGLLGLLSLVLHVETSFSCEPYQWELPGKVDIAVYSQSGFVHTILLIPPTGGETFLDRGLAKDLCKRGARVIVVQSWRGEQEPPEVLDLERHDRLTERAVSVFKQVIDWSGSRKVGVIGASLGGMYASYLTATDSRVASAVFVVAGGPISEVLAFGDQELLNGLRKARRRYFGYRNNTEYEEALSLALDWDTVRLARPQLRDRISVIIGESDVTVPTAQQWKLYQAWGAPDSLKIFPCNHLLSVFRAYSWNRDWIAQRLFAGLENQTGSLVAP